MKPIRNKGAGRWRFANVSLFVLVISMGATGALMASEIKESRLQARVLAWLAGGLDHWLGKGPNPSITYPSSGPYDLRHGYTRIPTLVGHLQRQGGVVQAQARWSPSMTIMSGLGLPPIYREKGRAGLTLFDRSGHLMYDASRRGNSYERFTQIPPVVAASLLFIENRELLDRRLPHRNPALEWQRLAHAFGMAGLRAIDASQKVPGGSTLATQMEKFRHSPGGRTSDAREKLRQMTAASLRAYLEGPQTIASRRRILRDYLNSVPLGAAPGWGEVNGLGDGLAAWFGADLEQVNELLSEASMGSLASQPSASHGQAYRQVLALLIGLRSPSRYLINDRQQLDRLSRSYVRVLARAGVIPAALGEVALTSELKFSARQIPHRPEARDVKAVEAVRVDLLRKLRLTRLYDLDRMDIAVHTTLDLRAQQAATATLRSLASPEVVQKLKLKHRSMLGAGDPAQVRYSFLLLERSSGANLVRIETDTAPGPFNLNEGMKLELGSTAKLRTLVSYLRLVAEIHQRQRDQAPAQLLEVAPDPSDRLGLWVLRWMRRNPNGSLSGLMEAAQQRRYSASPYQRFYTGGGLQRFNNYHSAENGKLLSVREAFTHSVNLPFVRMMEEIRQHLIHRDGSARRLLADPSHPGRRALLQRFADHEGKVFIGRFYRRYSGLTAGQALKRMARKLKPGRLSTAVALRTVRPAAGLEAFGAFLSRRAHDVTGSELASLYRQSRPAAYNLHDRGYIAGLHPLELWTLAALQRNPRASLRQLIGSSVRQRQTAYAWLFRPGRVTAQNNRIRQMLERDAFAELHRRWQQLGYPFPRLVPSLGTALGSSGDRPQALAELAGIISAGGVRLPTTRLTRVRFASNTPYDTVVATTPPRGHQRVMPPEVALAARSLMTLVVSQGTARQAAGVLGGGMLVLGGKTGTGDNRNRRVDRHGRVFADTAMSRTATFVFVAGDRWFGVVTAHVSGPQAANYSFTSSLPARLMRDLAPGILPAFGPPRPLVSRRPSRQAVKAQEG